VLPTAKRYKPARSVSRRRFLRVLSAGGAAALLAACGNAPQAAAPTSAPVAATSAPIAAATPAQAAYPRTVKDAGGREIVLQQRPERVVLDTYRQMLDELLLLDVAPLGYAAWLEEKLPVWTQQALDERGLTPINFNGQAYPAAINFEQLAAAQPDLIIVSAEGGKAEHVENMALFEQIAPVFVTDWASQGYDRLRLFAAIFGVEDHVAAIEARDDELFASVAPPPPNTELVVGFGYGAAGPIATQICHGSSEPSALVLRRAGFVLKDFGRPADESCFDIAEENFALLDTDMLWNVSPYPGTDGNPVPADARAFESSSIFQNLAVVKEGRYRSLTVDQSQALLQWSPLATPFLVQTLNEVVASYKLS
jgi:iron complex transport system substrate-binding protein